jgi:hypothetical protein
MKQVLWMGVAGVVGFGLIGVTPVSAAPDSRPNPDSKLLQFEDWRTAAELGGTALRLLPPEGIRPENQPARRGEKAPVYRVYPLRNGVCQIAGQHAFHEGNPDETDDCALYLWLILGGAQPMLVDSGLIGALPTR